MIEVMVLPHAAVLLLKYEFTSQLSIKTNKINFHIFESESTKYYVEFVWYRRQISCLVSSISYMSYVRGRLSSCFFKVCIWWTHPKKLKFGFLF